MWKRTPKDNMYSAKLVKLCTSARHNSPKSIPNIIHSFAWYVVILVDCTHEIVCTYFRFSTVFWIALGIDSWFLVVFKNFIKFSCLIERNSEIVSQNRLTQRFNRSRCDSNAEWQYNQSFWQTKFSSDLNMYSYSYSKCIAFYRRRRCI